FAFAGQYVPTTGIGRMLCGTQPILALAALDAALELWAEVDFAALEAKRMALSDFFITLVEERCPDLILASPRDSKRRASHVSFRHTDGRQILEALRAEGVIADFRSPDLLRFGLTPLTLGYADIFDAALCLSRVMDTE
ncbi:MAG: hypothetical protein ACREFN_15845, partial [Acetobacteraceae bacterium]